MKVRKKLDGKDILLFLDVDGVLNTSDSFHTKYQLEADNVKALAKLTEKLSDAGSVPKLILTSTWRLGYEPGFDECSPQIQKLALRLGEYGIHIHDRTSIYKNTTRDIEILRYIRGYALTEKDFAFITLDDDKSIYSKDAMKQINYYGIQHTVGLTDSDIDKIIRQIKKCR